MILEDIAAEPPSSLPLTPTSDGDTTTRPAVDTSTPSTHASTHRAASLDGGAPSSAGKSGAATERWQNGKSKVILKMKVAIGDGRQGTIHVFPGDDPKALAAQFCEKHELTERPRGDHFPSGSGLGRTNDEHGETRASLRGLPTCYIVCTGA